MCFSDVSQHRGDIFFVACVFLKGCFHRCHEEGSDDLRVAESHLRFAGMHIDIDLSSRCLQKGDEEGKASRRNRVAVSDAHDACKRSVLYRATIDEKKLFRRAIGMMRRKRAEGLQAHALLLRDDRKGIFQKETPHDLRDAFLGGVEGQGLTACGQEEFSFFVVEAFKMHIGVGKRDSLYLSEDECGFVKVATKEAQSCGCGEEEVLYLYIGALGLGGGLRLRNPSGFDKNFCALARLRTAFDERAADRGDGGKGFAAKTEGVNIQQVVLGKLGGCVSFYGEQQVFFVHAASVVLHA